MGAESADCFKYFSFLFWQYPPQPYQFGYDSNDDFGTTSFRKEAGDANGRVQGSYGYKDAQGIERIVEYVADENGYRAQVCKHFHKTRSSRC